MSNLTKNDKATDSNLDGGSLCPGHAPRSYRANQVLLPYPDPATYFYLTAARARQDLMNAPEIWEDALRRSPVDHRWCETCQCKWLDFLHTKIAEHEEIAKRVWEMQEASRLRRENKGKYTAKDGLGPREFTLTYGNHYEDDETAQAAMKQAIERLTRYYKNEIIEFHAVGEFTTAGRAHVHGWYHLDGGRKITDKNFKRAYPPWNPKRKLGKGHEGGHHATIDRVSDFAGYAEKHLEEAWLKVDITHDADEPASPQTSPRILAQVDGSDDSGEEGNSSR